MVAGCGFFTFEKKFDLQYDLKLPHINIRQKADKSKMLDLTKNVQNVSQLLTSVCGPVVNAEVNKRFVGEI